MKYFVLMLSMAAAMVLAAPTPIPSTHAPSADQVEVRDQAKVEKQPRFELPRDVLETTTTSGEASTDGNWAPIRREDTDSEDGNWSPVHRSTEEDDDGNWSPIKTTATDGNWAPVRREADSSDGNWAPVSIPDTPVRRQDADSEDGNWSPIHRSTDEEEDGNWAPVRRDADSNDGNWAPVKTTTK